MVHLSKGFRSSKRGFEAGDAILFCRGKCHPAELLEGQRKDIALQSLSTGTAEPPRQAGKY